MELSPRVGHAPAGLSTGWDRKTWDDWPRAVEAAQTAGGSASIELCAVRDYRLGPLLSFLESDALAAFGYVSVHAPAGTKQRGWDELMPLLERLPTTIETIIIHPEPDHDLAALRRLGGRVAIENMDAAKPFGRTREELARWFAELPAARFCLDVAHAWAVDPTLSVAHELLDAFGDRLKQMHVSGIDAPGTHRTTTRSDLDNYGPVLRRAPEVPWIFEQALELE